MEKINKKQVSIWVDADACPAIIRDIVCRAAQRTQTTAIFVANKFIRLPQSPYVNMLQVESGFDVADDTIEQRTGNDDIVITSDIPLAASVLAKGSFVLTSRGVQYTKQNINARLNMRDFMDQLRSSGVDTGGSAPFNHTDRQAFANKLDQILAKI